MGPLSVFMKKPTGYKAGYLVKMKAELLVGHKIIKFAGGNKGACGVTERRARTAAREPLARERWWRQQRRYWSAGFSARSMISISTGPLAGSSFRPSCSWMAVKIVGPVSVASGVAVRRSGVHSSWKS